VVSTGDRPYNEARTRRQGRRAFLVPIVAAFAAAAAACRKKTRVPTALPRASGAETGIASWYGHPYHGRRAASGEIYDMEQLTAAHRTLAFGTLVRVRNLTNGKTVEVRINDRGPFVDGRIIDLSRAAARAIDLIGPGTARVRLEVLEQPAGPSLYAVQVGAFRDRGNAERLRRMLARRFSDTDIVRRDANPPLWRVVVGREGEPARAAALAETLRRQFGQAFVVRLDFPAR